MSLDEDDVRAEVARMSAAATTLRTYMRSRSVPSLDMVQLLAALPGSPSVGGRASNAWLVAATSELVHAGRASWVPAVAKGRLDEASAFLVSLAMAMASSTWSLNLADIATLIASVLRGMPPDDRDELPLSLFIISLNMRDPLPLSHARAAVVDSPGWSDNVRAVFALSPGILGWASWDPTDARAAVRLGLKALQNADLDEGDRAMIRRGIERAQAMVAGTTAPSHDQPTRSSDAGAGEGSGGQAERRMLESSKSLFDSGDYRGAYLAADKALKSGRLPERLILAAKNLAALAQLQNGEYDELHNSLNLILNVAALSSVPVMAELHEHEPMLSPQGMVDEVAVHHTRSSDPMLRALVMIALEELADAEVLSRAAPGDWLQHNVDVTQRAYAKASTPDYQIKALGAAEYLQNTYRPSMNLDVMHVRVVEWNRRISLCVASVHLAASGDRPFTIPLWGSDMRLLLRLTEQPRTAEDLSTRELRRLRSAFFPFDLRTCDTLTLCVDQRLWAIPFEAICPEVQMVVVPSLGSWIRMPRATSPRGRRLRILHVADARLVGVAAEQQSLQQLHDQGSVEVQSVGTFADLRHQLMAGTFDVLVIGAHGHGDGAEFQIELEAESVSIAQFAPLQLPSIVVAATCMSGKASATAANTNLVSWLMSSQVEALVVALWDVSDSTAAEVLAQFYRLLAAGESAPGAWKQLETKGRPPASAGLRLIARTVDPDQSDHGDLLTSLVQQTM